MPESWKRAAAVLAGLLLLAGCYSGHGLDPEGNGDNPSGIQGNITFTGAWPDSTREVHLAVLRSYPEGIRDPDSLLAFVITNLVGTTLMIPKGAEEYAYEFHLDPGVYGWVLVVWFPDIPDYLFGAKELGAYYAPDDPVTPSPVHVLPGTLTPDIDIQADFSRIHREIPFFKSGRSR